MVPARGNSASREVGQRCLRVGRAPHAGHPLVAFGRLGPIAGDPLPTRRHVAPQATDPDVVVVLFIPGPVTGDPGDVFPFRLLLGGEFFDQRRWGLLHDRRDDDVVRRRRGERFVQRAARVDLGVFVVHARRRRQRRRRLGLSRDKQGSTERCSEQRRQNHPARVHESGNSVLRQFQPAIHRDPPVAPFTS